MGRKKKVGSMGVLIYWIPKDIVWGGKTTQKRLVGVQTSNLIKLSILFDRS